MNRSRCAAGFAVLLLGALGADAATMHDNDVYFSVNGLKGFNFTQTGYSITKGQPYGGVTSKMDSQGRGQLVVKAGRKSSTSVAAWFKQQAGTGQTLVCNTTGTYPKDLNFAVEGTLVMQVGDQTVTCDNIIIAQGHYGVGSLGPNNWWMAGPAMKGAHIGPTGVTEQTCKATKSLLGAVVTFAPETPCSKTFSLGVNILK
jgi:hypothetical protein